MGGSASQVRELSWVKAVCTWPGAGSPAASGGRCPSHWAQRCLASPAWASRIQGHISTVQVRTGALGEGKLDVLQVYIRQPHTVSNFAKFYTLSNEVFKEF